MSTPLTTRVFTLQDEVDFNASELNGTTVSNSGFEGVLIWFVPTGGYDGTVNFEFSPSVGDNVWFPIIALETGDVSKTYVVSVASPDGTNAYYANVPVNTVFRVRMSGGTQGSLSAFARLSNLDIT